MLYDLALGYDWWWSTGGKKYTGSNIPLGFIQKVDYTIRGQSMPEPVNPCFKKKWENNMLQREVVIVPKMYIPLLNRKYTKRGKDFLHVDSSYSTNTWSGELLDYKIPKVQQQWLVVPENKEKEKSKR